MEAPKISLLLADVDGTLVTQDKVLTPRAIAAVKGLREAGIRFAITSGRPPKGMEMLFEPLGIDTPVAGFNGGLFVHRDLSIIEEWPLPPDLAAKAVTQIRAHKLDCWLYAGNDWYVSDTGAPHVDRESWTVKFKPKVLKKFDDFLDKAVKIVGVSDDRDLIAQCEADLHKDFGDLATVAKSQPYYLDITHRRANKGAVADYLAEFLKIPTDEIATIGDQPNDMTMFTHSGFSIAMGNAPDEVKKQAKATTSSNEEDGFAKAVETYMLATM